MAALSGVRCRALLLPFDGGERRLFITRFLSSFVATEKKRLLGSGERAIIFGSTTRGTSAAETLDRETQSVSIV